MRSNGPWRLESTLPFLALLPLAMAASGLILEFAARAMGYSDSQRPAWLLGAGTGLLHAVSLVLIHALVRAHALSWREAFGLLNGPWMRHWRLAVVLTLPALVLAWAVHLGSIWVLEKLSIPLDAQTAVEAVLRASSFWERALLFLFAIVTAPAVEELVFRGILWPLARDRGWGIAGCVGVSLLFALIHLNIAAFLPLWVLGLFWTWLYERTGDLTAPILSHALFNCTNFVWLILSPPALP